MKNSTVKNPSAKIVRLPGTTKADSAAAGSRLTNIRFRLTQLVSAMLIVSILTISVPAAPVEVKAYLKNVNQRIHIQLLSGNLQASVAGWASALLLILPRKKQIESIGKIEITPGIAARRQGEPINFSAIGYTTDGKIAGGLKFKWTIKDVGRDLKEHNLPNGTFQAQTTGKFLITAEAEGVSAQTSVTVEENLPLAIMKKIKRDEAKGDQTFINKLKDKKQYTTENISSKNDYKDKKNDKNSVEAKNFRPVEVSRLKKSHGPNAGDVDAEDESAEPTASSAARAMRMMRPIDDQGWDGTNWYLADDPGNQTGTPPGTSPDMAAGSGNFQLSAPVVALPGRGIDLNLSLNYNSRLWSKAGANRMSYDSDRGFPAPGWSLGFGKIMFMGASGGCMLIDADGTRHGYEGTTSNYGSGNYTSSYFNGHTADGTFIDYSCSVSTYYGSTTMSAAASLPNGTQIQYYANSTSGQQAFPTQITDAQGNYINVAYRGNRGPEIQTVTDTMGRVVTFNYDSSTPSRLISVTTPAIDNAGTRTVVRLHYKQISLNPGFTSNTTTDAADWNPYVVDAIYYPGTDTGYWFNDADSYSPYGMIAKVVEQRGMSWSGAANDQGTVIAGTMSKQAVYAYPPSPDYSLTDAPTYAKLTESWAGMDTAPAETFYDIHENATPRTVTVTQPNGVKSKQTSYNYSSLPNTDPIKYKDGLIYQDETLDSANNQLSKSFVDWEKGDYNSPRPKQTDVTDEKGQTLSTVNTYGTTNYNQLISQKEYDYNSTTALLKETVTSYENNSAYTNRHIFSLVKTREIFDGAGARKARSDIEYDNNAVAVGTQNPNLKATAGVTMHLATADPYTSETRDGACLNSQFNNPQCTYEGEIVYTTPYPTEVTCVSECTEYEQVSAYDPNSLFRGNVTRVTGYTDAANLSGAIAQTKQYDDTGNLVAESASCCQLKTYDYTIATQFAYPTTQARGSSDPNSTVRNSTSAVYDFYTGLVKQTTDPNGRTTTNQYDSSTLRPTVSTAQNGAYSQNSYDESAMTVTSETHESGGNLASKSITYLNGVGQTVKQQALGANNDWDTVDTQYTNLGQVWQQSNPYRVIGDRVWTQTVYDLLGRTKQTIAPDNSVSEVFYNETDSTKNPNPLPTNLTGNTVRVRDAWGRERWGRYDAQQRLVEVVEPNPNGDGTVNAAGSLVTKYTYDTLGSLTETEQGVQHRSFKYDSLGRLTRQKMAEQTATLNDAGTYVGAGANWSEAFIYDERSNLTQKTDARGVKTNYYYSNLSSGAEDPLNRLQAIIYDLSGPHDTSQPINGAFNTVYEYMPSGDRDRIQKIDSTGLVKEEYAYDTEGRVRDYTQTVTNRENFPLQMTYIYDTLSRVKEIYYPAEYGLAGSPRKHIENTFDVASRLTTLTVDGQRQAGDMVFNAASQTTSINIGTAGTNQVNENYTFDPQTGLLTNQQVQRGAQMLLNLTYDYSRGKSIGNTTGGKTGQVTKITNNLDPSKARNYQYDALGRLTKAIGGATRLTTGVTSWTQQYAYDRYGNRQTVTASGSAADNSPVPVDGFANLSYDQTTNRITNAAFQYDAAGNQTRAQAEDGSWLRYEYDAANRLSIVKRDSDGAALQAYQYSPSNGRLMNYDYLSGEFILYANDGGTTVSEYHEYVSGTPTWTKSYVYLGDGLLSTVTPNGAGSETTDFDHPDRLGARVFTNQQSGANSEQASLPFGTALNAESTVTTNKNRFTSYDRSSRTGLDYAVNRSYDSKQGRFTQVDPIKMASVNPANPQTLNLYAYCGNDPINHTDPSGLFWGSLFRAIFKVLTNKWFRIAVAVAITILSVGAAGPLIITNFSFLAGTVTATTTVSVAGWFTAALTAIQFVSGVGAIANRFAGGDETIKVETRCPKTGATNDPLCPGSGARVGIGQPGFWVSLIPVLGSGLSAIDHFQNGEWGWGIFQTILAITDVLLVKSLITAGGKLLVKGGLKLAASESFEIAPRVAGQLADKRLGTLAGRMTSADLQRLINNPAAQRLFDTTTGNINVVQQVNGTLLRITTPRDAMRIISVGPIRANQITNGIANGRFIPLP